MKFIVSANQLRRVIHYFKENKKVYRDEEISIKIRDKLLYFNDIPEQKIVIECKQDGVINVEYQKILTLYLVLSAIEDQPIVIYFDGHKIDIQNLYI